MKISAAGGGLGWRSALPGSLEDAVRWYEERHAGLGMAFLAAVDSAFELVGRWPLAGEVVRRCRVILT